MAYAVSNANLIVAGSTYQIALGKDVADFRATLNGAAVSNPETLATLYAASRGLGFIERFLRNGNDAALTSEAVDSSRELFSQVLQVEALAGARDFIGKASGAIVSGMMLTTPYAPGLALKSLSLGAIREILTLDSSTIASISIKGLDLAISGVMLASGQQLVSSSIQLSRNIISAVNAGQAVTLDNVHEAANGLVNGYSILTNITAHLSANKELNATIRDDIRSLAEEFGSGYLSIFGLDPKSLGKTIETLAGVATSVSGVKSVVEMVENAAQAAHAFLTNSHRGYSDLSPARLRDFRNSFIEGTQMPVVAGRPDLVDVSTGHSENVISDARIYVSDMAFSEAYRGLSGFFVRLSEALPRDVTLHYAIDSIGASDSALAGEDFVPTIDSTLRISAGQTIGFIPVTIVDDDRKERLVESFRLSVFQPTGAAFSNGANYQVRTGLILDDDQGELGNTQSLQQVADLNRAAVDSGVPRLSSSGGQNLVATSFGATQIGAASGGETGVTYRVMNTGDETSSRGVVKVWLSRNANLQGTRFLAEEYVLPALDPGEARSYSRDVRLPASGNGSYYLGIELSSQASGDESTSADNIAVVPFQIGAGLSGTPDLNVFFDSIPTGIRAPGSTIEISYRISANASGAPAYRYRTYLSEDEVLSAHDLLFWDRTTDRGLGSSGVHYYSDVIQLPEVLRDGTHHIIVVADPLNALGERRENNNVFAREFLVSSAGPDANDLPNIVAESLSISQPIVATSTEVKFKVLGYLSTPDDPLFDTISQPFANLDVDLVVSEDAILSADDVVFQDNVDLVEAPIGDILGFGVITRMPAWLDSGEYYVFGVFDLRGKIAEDNESDNATAPFRIEVINDTPRSVEAHPDQIEIFEGRTGSINLLTNDVSLLGQELVLYKAMNDFVDSSGFVHETDGLSVTFHRDGTMTVDASALTVPLAPGEAIQFELRYAVAGTDASRDIGAVTIQVSDPELPSPLPVEYVGTDADDEFVGGDLSDQIGGRSGRDRLDGGDGSDAIWGHEGADTLSGGVGSDTLDGGAGNDQLNGGTGIDRLLGGLGDDTYIVDRTSDEVIELAGEGNDLIKSAKSFVLPDNIEQLSLTGSGNVNGTGNALGNVLVGNAGANRLQGGLGSDTMNGAGGNDTYLVDQSGDEVVEALNKGLDVVEAWVDYTLRDNVENLSLMNASRTILSPVIGRGNSRANTIIGNSRGNTIEGLGGSDNLEGRGGNDTLKGGAGADNFFFNTTPNSSGNSDTLADFAPNADKIMLDDDVFKAFDAAASSILTSAQFGSGAGMTTAATSAQRIVYNTTTGDLYYDADGVGLTASIRFATLGASTHPSIGTAAFMIVT